MDPRGGSANHHSPALDPEPMRPPTNIFILPPEIRQIIWEYAIAEGRILQPRGRFDSSQNKWILGFPRTRQHSLTQVFSETREIMLKNGAFIFGKDPKEPGLWWNSNVDTLLFTHKWDLRFEWNALEGLQGLDKVKSVIIDQDLARWISYHAIYADDDPEYEPSKTSPGSLEKPVGFRLCYPDDAPYFKFFLFNGIHPDNLTVLFTRVLQEPDGRLSGKGFDIDDFPDQRVEFDFLNDELDEVEQKMAQLWSLWRQSKQNHPDRDVTNMDSLIKYSTLDKPGPLFRKGASWRYEKEEEDVDVTLLSFFKDMETDPRPSYLVFEP